MTCGTCEPIVPSANIGIMNIELLFWTPLVAASLHIFEEFVWPGGFGAWYRDYRPEFAPSISPRWLIGINALLLGVCAIAGLAGTGPRAASLLVTLLATFAVNAIFHIRATLRKRRYSPGVVTSVAIYVPLAVAGITATLANNLITPQNAVISAILGSSYQLIASAMHARRAAVR